MWIFKPPFYRFEVPNSANPALFLCILQPAKSLPITFYVVSGYGQDEQSLAASSSPIGATAWIPARFTEPSMCCLDRSGCVVQPTVMARAYTIYDTPSLRRHY